MGYPLSVRGQVCRAQGPLPCVAATVLCSWRLPSLGRVPMSSVPRRRRYYEGATTSHHASRSLLVRDRVPRGPPRFVLAEALPGGWRSRPSLGRLVRRRPGSGWRPRGRGGISQVPRRSIPCLCPAQRPRPRTRSDRDAGLGSRSAFIVPATAGNRAHRDPSEGREARREAPGAENRCRDTREGTLSPANLSTNRQRIAHLARTRPGVALTMAICGASSTGESRTASFDG